MAKIIPRRYRQKKTVLACVGKKHPQRRTYIGIRAEQLMKGVIRIVISLDDRLSIILVPIIAGTLHPKPIIRGIKDFPCSPILCMSLSIMNATRAMYPLSSIKDINA